MDRFYEHLMDVLWNVLWDIFMRGYGFIRGIITPIKKLGPRSCDSLI